MINYVYMMPVLNQKSSTMLSRSANSHVKGCHYHDVLSNLVINLKSKITSLSADLNWEEKLCFEDKI